MFENDKILDNYYDWLKSKSFEKKISENIWRISLPFLNVNNDYLEIYVIHQADGIYKLTDDSTVYTDLELFGFNFTEQRTKLLTYTINSYGVTISDKKEIFIMTDKNDFLKKNIC